MNFARELLIEVRGIRAELKRIADAQEKASQPYTFVNYPNVTSSTAAIPWQATYTNLH